MAVRFILGRAGTGKTWHCFEQIAGLLRADPLGPPIFWLLPRQATFQAQRDLACRLGGFNRVHVLSFDEFGHEILTSTGDIGIPEVTPVGRRLVIGHLLRTHQKQLKFYPSCARRPGLAAELDSTFGEFVRAGIDAAALEQSLKRFEADDSLSKKLSDLSLLLSAYQTFIGQERLDPHRRIELVMQRVSDFALLDRAAVFIDGFFDFTAFEQKMIVALANRSPRTEIALLVDPASPVVADPNLLPDELSLFHRTERAFRSLHWALHEAEIAIDPPLLLRDARRFTARPLVELERNVFADAPVPSSPQSAVEFFDAPDAAAEVDAVARRIRAALQAGLRLRDIAVLLRNLDEYHELIQASFTEHDLPHFSDRRRTAAHHPLLQFVRSVLQIARDGFQHDAVMTLVKTGLAGLNFDEADEMENYVLRHRIRGQMWRSAKPWTFRLQVMRAEEATSVDDSAPRVDALRQKLVDRLSPFISIASPNRTFAQFVAQLSELLAAFDVRGQLLQWMTQAESAGQLEQRGEHEQVWMNLVELLEHISGLLGNEHADIGDFLECIETGLETFDLALTPQTIDGILVGQIDRTRTPPIKLAFVLGLNRGTFPSLQRPDCVLSDSQRAVLSKNEISLDPDTQRRMLDERLLAYFAFTRASDRLVLSRPLADADGRAANPSIFWNQVLQLFSPSPGTPAFGSEAQARRGEGRGGGTGKTNATLNAQRSTLNVEVEEMKNIVRHEVRGSVNDAGAIATPRQLVTALMRWVRDGAAADDPWPGLYQWFAQYECCGDAIDVMRYRAWKALSYSNSAAIAPSTAAGLFSTPLRTTVAQIESFAACPFQHFVLHGLRLAEREASEVTARDLGQIYHRILDRLVREILAEQLDWRALAPDDLAERISVYAKEIGQQIRGELMLSSARNQFLLERIESTLLAFVQGQREMHRRGKFRPAFSGVRFGDGEKIPAFTLATPAGRQVHVSGNIDRVDLHETDDLFSIVDYKLSAQGLALERVFHGISLQLVIDLLAVADAGPALNGKNISAAAAFVSPLLCGLKSLKHPSEAVEAGDPDFHLRNKPRGIIASGAIASLDSNTTRGHSPVVQLFINKDGRIGNRHNTDVADEAELAALLRQARLRLGELADRLAAGEISVHPYWLHNQTPCSRCSCRSVCRFEPGINSYNMLVGMDRQEVLTQLTIGARDAD